MKKCKLLTFSAILFFVTSASVSNAQGFPDLEVTVDGSYTFVASIIQGNSRQGVLALITATVTNKSNVLAPDVQVGLMFQRAQATGGSGFSYGANFSKKGSCQGSPALVEFIPQTEQNNYYGCRIGDMQPGKTVTIDFLMSMSTFLNTAGLPPSYPSNVSIRTTVIASPYYGAVGHHFVDPGPHENSRVITLTGQ